MSLCQCYYATLSKIKRLILCFIDYVSLIPFNDQVFEDIISTIIISSIVRIVNFNAF